MKIDRALAGLVAFLLIAGCLFLWDAEAAAKDARRGYVIMVDPAHGGEETGVRIGGEVFEKQITLAIAEQLKIVLEKTGRGKIGLTRTDDRTVSPANRIKAASEARADLFLSIHVNAGFDKQASGFEVHYQGYRALTGQKGDSGEIVKDMVRTQSVNESLRFAQILQRQLDRVFPRKDRGLRDSPLRILHGLSIPAVAVETAFATNPNDRKAILNPTVHRNIAEALGKSVEEYF